MVVRFRLTVSSTLGHRSLTTTTSDADAVDHIALLGLVSQAAGLVWSRWARSAVDDIQLSQLYSCTLSKVQRVYSKTQAFCATADDDKKSMRFIALLFSSSSCFGEAHLPAADSEKESKDIGLLLLLKFFHVFEGTHLRAISGRFQTRTGLEIP